MEIRQLQLFIALAEEGSFTKAAHRMNIVQSGLSISIKALEQELGTRQFESRVPPGEAWQIRC